MSGKEKKYYDSSKEVAISRDEFDMALYEFIRYEYDDNPASLLDIKGVKEAVLKHHYKDIFEYALEEHKRKEYYAKARSKRASEVSKALVDSVQNLFDNAQKIKITKFFEEEFGDDTNRS